MKKMVLVTASGAVAMYDTSDEIDLDKARETIGGWVEIVRNGRLPEKMVMLVDEEGLLKRKPINMAGSWFYRTDIHGSPIVGDILIVKEDFGPEGPTLYGLTTKEAEEVCKAVLGRKE